MTSYPKWGTQTLRELCFHACTGDIEKVQQCIKNGSMLSTDPEDDGMIKQELQHFICCPIGFYAAANGHMDILQLFIEKGHDITSVTDKNTIWYLYKNSRTKASVWMTRGLLEDDSEWPEYDQVHRLEKGLNLQDFLKQIEAYPQLKALRAIK